MATATQLLLREQDQVLLLVYLDKTRPRTPILIEQINKVGSVQQTLIKQLTINQSRLKYEPDNFGFSSAIKLHSMTMKPKMNPLTI